MTFLSDILKRKKGVTGLVLPKWQSQWCLVQYGLIDWQILNIRILLAVHFLRCPFCMELLTTSVQWKPMAATTLTAFTCWDTDTTNDAFKSLRFFHMLHDFWSCWRRSTSLITASTAAGLHYRWSENKNSGGHGPKSCPIAYKQVKNKHRKQLVVATYCRPWHWPWPSSRLYQIQYRWDHGHTQRPVNTPHMVAVKCAVTLSMIFFFVGGTGPGEDDRAFLLRPDWADSPSSGGSRWQRFFQASVAFTVLPTRKAFVKCPFLLRRECWSPIGKLHGR